MKYRPKISGNMRAGAAALELAIILPFLIFVFAVVVDYSRVYIDSQQFEVTIYNTALYDSGFAYAPAQSSRTSGLTSQGSASQSAATSTSPTGSVTVSDNANFALMTTVLNSGSVNMARSLTAPNKP